MGVVKIIEVEDCFTCPYSTWYLSQLGMGSQTVDFCYKAKKEFEKLDEEEGIMIESWCPLEG